MNRKRSVARLWLGGTGIVSIAAMLPPARMALANPPAQLSAQDAALVRLNAGRRAFNEKNYPAASAAFKEFLANNSGHREAAGAWFGLGLCILQTTSPDLTAAADAFHHAAADAEFSERPTAQYYFAYSLRALGNRASADAIARPNEAESLGKTAAQKYTEAAAEFAAAQTLFDKRAAAAPPAQSPLPIDVEWSARSRCDAAEMLLRIGKYKEALDACAGFQTDPILSRSRYRHLGLYHLGYAQFSLRDYLSAGRSLSQLAPFAQDFGLHARYLLARVHHLADERPEAANLYKAIQDDFENRRKAAEKVNLDSLADMEQRAAREQLLHGPAPEYVLRARFYGAVLAYEDGRYSDAAEVFTKMTSGDANNPLVQEAKLRLGYCQLQLKKFGEAIAALEPLRENKQFADRALWWDARAKVGAANSNNAQEYQNAVVSAIDMLRRAEAAARDMAANDPDAKNRRRDILLELGDMQQLAKKYKESAHTYQQIVNEDPKSDRAQEAMQRKVTALHLGGNFAESDTAGDQFASAYPKSTLLPAVLFRQAENAYMTALAAADGENPRSREEQEKLFGAGIERYQKLIKKYPEYEYGDLARQALAICNARVGHFPDAIAVLATIPDSNQTGDLALVPYLMADCEIRTFAPETDDALTAERLIQTAEDAAKYLESFISAQPKAPQTPDAMLKLGYCYQRIAEQIAPGEERTKMLTKAREAYDRANQQFANDKSMPSIIFERAKVLAEMNDAGGAQNELSRFLNDPLRKTPNAPLAMIRLSSIWRATGQTQQAVDLMKRCRDDFEPALANDPARAAWIPLLRYEHGRALQDARKLPEARAIYEQIIEKFAGKPQAINARWRLAQCRRQEADEKLAEARSVAHRGGVNAAEVTNAYAKIEDAMKELALAADALAKAAEPQAAAGGNPEPAQRVFYELAWCNRVLGDAQSDAVRLRLQRDALDKVRANWPKELSALPAALGAPEVSISDVPLQPSEQKAQQAYQRVIALGPGSTLAAHSRFELAELLSQRGQVDAALDLMATALENLPPKELTQRIKVSVAAALLSKDDPNSALQQLKPILAARESAVAGEARYLAGEAYIHQKDWPKAIETLLPFREQDPLRNIAGVSDRALMRLAFAYGEAKQWDQSRSTYDLVVNRYGQSQWINDARFGMAWALQSQQHYDEAMNLYNDLRNRTAAEPAARAMLNIGVCKIEQKHPDDALKLLLAVPQTYDYPDCTAAAWYQAARAHVEIKQPEEAAKLWTRVVKDFPATSWAALSQQKLSEMK